MLKTFIIIKIKLITLKKTHLKCINYNHHSRKHDIKVLRYVSKDL